MALTNCKECGREISSKASACPHCGAKIPKFKWWLWIPLGLIVAFFSIGWLTPQYEIDAIQRRNACELMIKSEPYRQRECDKIYSDTISRGKAEGSR